MTPALLMRISSLSDLPLNVSAAVFTDSREARSRCRKVMLALGTVPLISAMADSALDGVRAAKYM